MHENDLGSARVDHDAIGLHEKARQPHPWSGPANDAAGERRRDAVRVWGPAPPIRRP